MKSSFLKSLTKTDLTDAETKVKAAGHDVIKRHEDEPLPSLAQPNTVILWHDDKNKVVIAEASDPTEVVP